MSDIRQSRRGVSAMERPPRAVSEIRHADLTRHRAEFPLLSATTYLNTCSLGPLSTRSRLRLGEFLARWDELGARAWYRHWLGEVDALRGDYAWAIGATPDEIAIHANVSGALTAVASSLRYGERPRVLVSDLDFPTLGHQWLARRGNGVEVDIVRSPDGLTVPLDAWERALDRRVGLVATSQVFFTTGWVQDISALARLCHERGALLLVDAYQGTGLIPTDVHAADVDFLVGGTLKWLFGGPGNAFLYVRRALHDLAPGAPGWFADADQFAFDVTAFHPAPDARRFEAGTPALPSVAIARGGLEVVREVGVERIHERVVDLTRHLIGACRSAGLEVRAVDDDAARGGIVCLAADDPKAIVGALAAEGIIVDYRPGLVRVSPGFYTTVDELDLLVERLSRIAPERAVQGLAAR